MSVTMQFIPGSLERFRRSMQARSKLLHEDQKVVLTKASIKALTALRASAEKSGRKREIIKNPDRTIEKATQHGRHKSRHPKWAIHILSQKKETYLPVRGARTMADAKLHPAANIKNQGLAKSSFTWMMGKLGSKQGGGISEMFGVTSVDKVTKFEGLTMFLKIRMVNKLNYIQKAFKMGGDQAVASALARAREMLNSDTRRALKARMT